MNQKDLIVIPILLIMACICITGCIGSNNNYGGPPVSTTSIPVPSTTTAPPATLPPGAGQTVTIDLSAKNMTFNTSVISVPAGATVVVNFSNLEPKGSAQLTGIPHNFAVYENADAKTPIFVGEIITGGQNITYTFSAPIKAGTYVFRCDVHPAVMTGKFIVT